MEALVCVAGIFMQRIGVVYNCEWGLTDWGFSIGMELDRGYAYRSSCFNLQLDYGEKWFQTLQDNDLLPFLSEETQPCMLWMYVPLH